MALIAGATPECKQLRSSPRHRLERRHAAGGKPARAEPTRPGWRRFGQPGESPCPPGCEPSAPGRAIPPTGRAPPGSRLPHGRPPLPNAADGRRRAAPHLPATPGASPTRPGGWVVRGRLPPPWRRRPHRRRRAARGPGVARVSAGRAFLTGPHACPPAFARRKRLGNAQCQMRNDNWRRKPSAFGSRTCIGLRVTRCLAGFAKASPGHRQRTRMMHDR